MKFCIECGAQLDDATVFCTQCGTKQPEIQAEPVKAPKAAPAAAPVPTPAPAAVQKPSPAPKAAPVQPKEKKNYDHTAEMDKQDISDNKILAMLVYLCGILGIIVAALVAKESKFVQFHIRQAIKLTLATVLAGFVIAVAWWTVIGLIAGFAALAFLEVLAVIQFVQVCMGKAIEPVLVRELPFMK